MTVPLSILDLSPVPDGGTVPDALRNTLDLARRAEEYGYHRYWLAEHHFAAGVASSAPAVLIALVAAATNRIRVGSGAVQLGHQTPLAVVEQFGLVDALHPGRIDLGLGRSGQRRAEEAGKAVPEQRRRGGPAGPGPAGPGPGGTGSAAGREREARVVDGLLIPPPFDYSVLVSSPRLAFQASLLQQPGAGTPDFADQVDDIAAFLNGTYRSPDGLPVHAVPGEGAGVELWILGSSGGQSAQVAGERGLPFAANYHVSPSGVLEAVETYREAFKPSETLAEPYVIVSADAVVAEDDAAARELAKPYGLWVRSIRSGQGAIPYPTPEQADAHSWSEEDRALVADRLDTRFVGSPETVAGGLDVLRRVTGTDELLVTTVTHAHADRVRSYELLALAWHGR
ncbi:MsnO8 family LLM class oxidoreductase [Planomonospora sp. ID91781]|uniref:MsnO8 family LLM class oxidoreductase n=1 Tax=Planomonospora sp. ID91781 TaxID=2738135 RepID=UPI0018C3BF7D|nr:MsnO8 family LLM class oxidoreductase [Planomonospora sp. ID91781]MBG0822651.1 MsnO8 family LLM class oxidoreductase [Planomonospora sp. ID91781]